MHAHTNARTHPHMRATLTAPSLLTGESCGRRSHHASDLPLGNVYAVSCSPTKGLIVVTVTTDRPPLSRCIQRRREAAGEMWLLRAIISSRCNATPVGTHICCSCKQ